MSTSSSSSNKRHLLAVPPSVPLEVSGPTTSRLGRKQGPTVSQTTLTVTNPSATTSAAFKIKTNQPRRYSVAPTIGVIGAGASALVTVTLEQGHVGALREAFEAGKESFYSSDKFMVLGTALSEGDLQRLGDPGAFVNDYFGVGDEEKKGGENMEEEEEEEEGGKENTPGGKGKGGAGLKFDSKIKKAVLSYDDRLRKLWVERQQEVGERAFVAPGSGREGQQQQRRFASRVAVEMSFPGATMPTADMKRRMELSKQLAKMEERLDTAVDDVRSSAVAKLQESLLMSYHDGEEEEADDPEKKGKGDGNEEEGGAGGDGGDEAKKEERRKQASLRLVITKTEAEKKVPSMRALQAKWRAATKDQPFRKPPSIVATHASPEEVQANQSKREAGLLDSVTTPGGTMHSQQGSSSSSSSGGGGGSPDGGYTPKSASPMPRTMTELREVLDALQVHFQGLLAFSIALTGQRDRLAKELEEVSEALREMSDPVLAQRRMARLAEEEQKEKDRAAQRAAKKEERREERRKRKEGRARAGGDAAAAAMAAEEEAAEEAAAEAAEREEEAAEKEEEELERLRKTGEAAEEALRNAKKEGGNGGDEEKDEGPRGFNFIQLVVVAVFAMMFGRLFPLRDEFYFDQGDGTTDSPYDGRPDNYE